MKKKSLADKIRAHLTKYPDDKVKDVALKFNVSVPYVYGLRSKLKASAETDGWRVIGTYTSHNPMADQLPVTMEPATTDVDATLAERGKRYGTFKGHAEVTVRLKDVLRDHAEKLGKTFSADQIEALHMICHKLGRIVNGDPDYADSWIDIAGYAKLVADRLEGKEV